MSEEDKKVITGLTEAIKDFTNEMRRQDPNRLLTAEDIRKEHKIGEATIYKMFQNPEIPVQSFTKPAKVLNSALWDFFKVRHEEI